MEQRRLSVMRRDLVAIGVAAFAIRIAVGVATGSLWKPELFEYDSAARAILEGKGFVYYHIGVPYYSYMAPLPTWVAVASYWTTGSPALLMMLQCLAGGVLAVVTAVIADRLSPTRMAALIAGGLVAVHPGLIVYSASKAHPLVFDALFFALTLLLILRLRDRPSFGRALALGVVAGVGAYSRGTIVIFLPLACVWLLVTTTAGERWAAVRAGVIAGIVAAAIIAPWVVRSSLTHHRFVFMLTTDAEDFWRGNNPYATGHSYIDADRIVLTSIPPEELADLQRQPDEIAQADWFATRARAFIREHPGQFVRLTLTKLYHFWWFAPQSGVLYPRLWLRAYQAYYVAVLLLAALGVGGLVRADTARRQQLWLILAFAALLSVLQSLYYVEGRHRWAVEPAVIALGGVGAALLAAGKRHTDSLTPESSRAAARA